ncbi:hypothetical protein KIN20_009955 [Parelaphostrongylus tenuis]|uniref:Uncharacterized protein n=1 Tax=Parelaphostrongylus tenuis TaxID=148309 RepID=A0AAD5M8W6_PARTN|nr:hypothetical protein KIN20_009955 [Parelaphostrongylus tenuis]
MEGYVLCDEEMLDIEPPFDDSLKAGVVVMDIQKDCGFGNIINRVDTMFDNEVSACNISWCWGCKKEVYGMRGGDKK